MPPALTQAPPQSKSAPPRPVQAERDPLNAVGLGDALPDDSLQSVASGAAPAGAPASLGSKAMAVGRNLAPFGASGVEGRGLLQAGRAAASGVASAPSTGLMQAAGGVGTFGAGAVGLGSSVKGLVRSIKVGDHLDGLVVRMPQSQH